MKNVCLCLLLLLNVYMITSTNNTKTLKLVQIFFRHGDKTPTETYPNDPYQHWSEGWGSLTKIGKQQMYKLGQLLRKRYKDFLSEYYFPEFVQVRSSAADRCIASAETVVAGLFPPVGDQIWNSDLLWQPIPVHYVPRNRDSVITMKKTCRLYTEALKKAYESPRIQKINEENKDLYNYLSRSTGGNINDILAAELLYNTLNIEIRNNLTLPTWVNDTLLNKLEQLSVLNYAIFSDNTLMKKFTGGGFLKEAISYMTNKINQTNNLNLVLYAGHDINIVSITRTLGFETEFPEPDHGASIVFELYENEVKDYEIVFLYGNNYETPPKKFEMKLCSAPCTLEKFIDGYDYILPKNWDLECSNPYKHFTFTNSSYSVTPSGLAPKKLYSGQTQKPQLLTLMLISILYLNFYKTLL